MALPDKQAAGESSPCPAGPPGSRDEGAAREPACRLCHANERTILKRSTREATAMQNKCAACREDTALPFEFKIAFQPIVDLSRDQVWGYEALVRGPNYRD
jgi:predicted signal transduction protein with EAL and GGDEF domain